MVGVQPFREQQVSDLADGDQTQRVHSEMPYDRDRALAHSTPLAIAIRRLQVGVNSRSLNAGVLEIHREFRNPRMKSRREALRLPLGDLWRICGMAIAMKLEPHCRKCKGVGEFRPKGAAVITCEDCGGSRVHNFTERDRAHTFGRAQWTADHSNALEDALAIYAHHETLASSIAIEWLDDD